MKRIRTIFLTGILVLVPLLATFDILRWFVRVLDTTARTYIPYHALGVDFVGLGVLIAILLIFLTGLLAHNILGRWFIGRFDTLVKKFPLVGGIYGSIKNFLSTVLNPQSDRFQEAVLVDFPRPGIKSIGFLTGKPDSKLIKHVEGKEHINVFVPCTPNPTSGFYLLVPKEELIPLDMPVQKAFKVLISMGVVSDSSPDINNQSLS